MVKKTGTRRQVIPHGVSKGNKGQIRRQKDEKSLLVALLKKSGQDWLVKKAEKCIKFIRKVPGQWCILPVVEVDSQRFAAAPLFRRVIGFVLIALIVFLGIVRAVVLIQGISNETITKVQAVLIVLGLIVLWGAWLIALPCILKPQATVDLLNASEIVLDHLGRRFGRRISYFNSVVFCLQVICLQWFVIVIPFEFNGVIVLFGPLPTDILSLVQNLGWIPPTVIPHIFWSLLFCILEYSIVLACALAAIFSVHVLTIGVATTKCCLNNIQREISVTDMKSREELEDLCLMMQVYNKVFTVWEKVSMPLLIVLVSCGVIVLMYIVIRGTELPLMIYCMMPLLCVSVSGLFNMYCVEMIRIKKSSENILSTLHSSTPEYLRRMERSERLAVLKRAKSIRPSLFPIGDYGEISYGMVVNMWEEVLNQLLLLLSL